MLLTKEVEVRLNGFNVKYYEGLGYEIPMRKPTKNTRQVMHKDMVYDLGNYITVKTEDLQPNSKVAVDVLCDYCKEEIVSVPYYSYIKRLKNVDKFACKNCASIKLKEVVQKTYGVDSTSQLQEVKQKMIDTNIKKYGVEYYAQTKECREKMRNTTMERYGVENASQLKSVKDKMKRTSMERYGVDSPSKSPQVREKMVRTLYENSSQKASKQQRYICNMYNGVLNYPIKYYNADIYLSDDNLVVEYDGGGHNLNVVTGRETQEEHDQKEIIRNNIIKREGYKQMTIISSRDLLPSDSILLQMLDDAKRYFADYPQHSWIEYNIDSSTVRNAENKDGAHYDFGELRKIHQSDISDDAA